MLLAVADAESAKEDEKDEEIIDAERCLDGVAGSEFECCLMAFFEVEPEGESASGTGYKQAPEPCELGSGLIGAAMRQQCVGGDESEDGDVEADPPQEWGAGDLTVP